MHIFSKAKHFIVVFQITAAGIQFVLFVKWHSKKIMKKCFKSGIEVKCIIYELPENIMICNRIFHLIMLVCR